MFNAWCCIRSVAWTIHERCLGLFGHVERFPEINPARRVAIGKGNFMERRGKGALTRLEVRPRRCVLLKLTRVGKGSAWEHARRNSREGHHWMSETMFPATHTSHNWLPDSNYLTLTLVPYLSKIVPPPSAVNYTGRKKHKVTLVYDKLIYKSRLINQNFS